jgi:RNA polymerase sigma-70 factor, ECF subfamily
VYERDSDFVNAIRLCLPARFSEEKREREWIRAAQQGNRDAFDALIQPSLSALRGYVVRRVGRDAADDVLQETLFAGWVSLPRYSRKSRFKAWIFAIASHKCSDYFREQGKFLREVPLEAAMDIADPKSNAHEIVVWGETLEAALRELPAEQRETLELYYNAELTLAEIAKVLDRNLSTVKYQFYRAHVQVEQRLNREANSSPVSVSERKTLHK